MSENPPVNDPAEVFRRTRQLALAGDFAGFVDLFADNAVLEFPFTPVPPINGHAGITEFMIGSGRDRLVRFTEFRDLVLHHSTDPEVVLAEFDGIGTVTATGAPFHRRYVHVLRVRAGQIVSYRDYSAPVTEKPQGATEND
jgi:uncharacterized protein